MHTDENIFEKNYFGSRLSSRLLRKIDKRNVALPKMKRKKKESYS